jgi:hypothetical protein
VRRTDACHETIPQSVTNDVNNAVSVVRFFAPSPTALLRNDSLLLAPRTAYRINDTLYLRADFAGLAIASARVNALASAYETGPMVPRYTLDSADIYPSPPAVCGMIYDLCNVDMGRGERTSAFSTRSGIALY